MIWSAAANANAHGCAAREANVTPLRCQVAFPKESTIEALPELVQQLHPIDLGALQPHLKPTLVVDAAGLLLLKDYIMVGSCGYSVLKT
jgi:hypothetical protein